MIKFLRLIECMHYHPGGIFYANLKREHPVNVGLKL